MTLPEQEPLPPAVNRLKQQVQKWRQAKDGQFSLTPGAFWDAAVPLAVKYGVCRIARAVELDYGGLRKRVAAMAGKPSPEPSITFVEIPASGMAATEHPASDPRQHPAPESGLVIDISRPDGARMRISLKPGTDLDAAGIVSAFVGAGL